VETTPREDLGEDVSRCSHTLTRGSSYRNGESPVHMCSPLFRRQTAGFALRLQPLMRKERK